MACWPSPHLTGHGLRPPALFCCTIGRSALFMVGRPVFWSICHFWLADHCSSAFGRYFMPAVIAGIHNTPPPYTCMEGFPSCLACFVSLARVDLYKGRASPHSLKVPRSSKALRLGLEDCVSILSLYLSRFVLLCGFVLTFVHILLVLHVTLVSEVPMVCFQSS